MPWRCRHCIPSNSCIFWYFLQNTHFLQNHAILQNPEKPRISACCSIRYSAAVKYSNHVISFSEYEDNYALLECILPVATKYPLDFAKSIKKWWKKALIFCKIQLSAKSIFLKTKNSKKKMSIWSFRPQIFMQNGSLLLYFLGARKVIEKHYFWGV